MKNHRRLIKYSFLFIVCFLITSNLKAQYEIDKNGGSLYSIFGLGDLNYSASSRTDAMGIMGLSLTGNYTNIFNPAAWSRIPITRFSTRFTIARINSTDGTNKSIRTLARFEGFNLSVPANYNNGWIIDAGLNQFSEVNYDIKLRGNSDGDEYTQYYSGNGGLSRISLGFSYLLTPNLSFGLQGNYLFGIINKTTVIDFDNTSIFDTKNIVTNSLSGYYISTGLIFNGFGRLFKNKKLNDLSLGLYFVSPGKINSTIEGRFTNSVEIDSVSLTEGNHELPWGGGFGISNIFSKTFLVSADVFYQNWVNYKSYGIHPNEIKDNLRLGMGFEYTPTRKFDESIFRRMSYRFGANYTMDYIKVNGESINSFGFSAGFQIPLSRFNSLDLVFNYTRRGKTTNALIKDDVLKVSASFNIGELWFLKPKEE